MIDEKTPNAALPLPHIDNFLEEDVTRLREALTMVDEQLAAADAARSALAGEMEEGLTANAQATAAAHEAADAAQNMAEAAQTAAESAQSTADAAKTEASDWTASKPGIVQRVDTLETEMDAVETAAANAQATANTANADSGVAAGSYGHPGNYAPAHGQGFYVPYFTVNAKGKVTGAMNAVITMPAAVHCTHCSYCTHCVHCSYCTYCANCSSNCNCSDGGWC